MLQRIKHMNCFFTPFLIFTFTNVLHSTLFSIWVNILITGVTDISQPLKL